MAMTTETPDILFAELKQAVLNSESYDWQEQRHKLEILVGKHIDRSKMAHTYQKFIQATNGDKTVRVLDYGCGGGQFIFYLLLLGYRRVHGIDVSPQAASINNILAQKLNFPPAIFTSYDRKTLPYEKTSFDIIISQQVLEHVHNLDDYYREASRVLAPEGVALLDFPHRMMPFDSHSKCWFIHYLPRFLRKPLYNVFTSNGADYFEKILNLCMLSTHKHIALNYFSSFLVTTEQRIKNFTCGKNYEGNFRLRQVADILMHVPFFGAVITRVLAPISIADVELRK